MRAYTYADTKFFLSLFFSLCNGKCKTDPAVFYRLLDQIQLTNVRYISILVGEPTRIRFMYYGYKAGLFVPRRDPYVTAGFLGVPINGMVALSAAKAAAGVDVSAPGTADPTWALPPEASLLDVFKAHDGSLIGVLLGVSERGDLTHHLCWLSVFISVFLSFFFFFFFRTL
jgi:hypothetical protein